MCGINTISKSRYAALEGIQNEILTCHLLNYVIYNYVMGTECACVISPACFNIFYFLLVSESQSERQEYFAALCTYISSKVTDLKQSTLTALYEKQVLRKATKIINDNTHILHNEYVLLPSSRRFRTIT